MTLIFSAVLNIEESGIDLNNHFKIMLQWKSVSIKIVTKKNNKQFFPVSFLLRNFCCKIFSRKTQKTNHVLFAF